MAQPHLTDGGDEGRVEAFPQGDAFLRQGDRTLTLAAQRVDEREQEHGLTMGARRVELAAFGVVAAFLALIGVYGVRSYLVARRTREVGIRMALGATQADVLRMVLREGMALVSVGLAIGVLLALAVGAALKGLIYQISEHDPVSFAGAAALLTLASVLACYLPALRATRVQANEALRSS